MKFLAALLFAGKLGKVLTTSATMLVSVFAYALLYGWRYAAGFVALLFAHEMGHFLAARKLGIAVGAPVFIPFVGAWVALKEAQLEPENEAQIAMAGPMLGTAAAFFCYLVAQDNGSRLLLAVAYSGFFLNLFNLLPLAPLDGGRIVSVISPKLWLLGVPILGALFIWRPSPMLAVIAIMAAPHVWEVLRGRGSVEHLTVSPKNRLSYGVQYIVLASTLAVLAFDVHETLNPS